MLYLKNWASYGNFSASTKGKNLVILKFSNLNISVNFWDFSLNFGMWPQYVCSNKLSVAIWGPKWSLPWFPVFQVFLRLTTQYAAQRCVAARIPTCIFYYNGFKQAIRYNTFCQGQHGRLLFPWIRVLHGLTTSARNPEGFCSLEKSWYLATGHPSKVQ